MSLLVTVINKDSGEQLVNHKVLVDDKLSILKEKLFVSSKGPINYFPNLISVYVGDTIVTEDKPLFVYAKSESMIVVYVSNIIESSILDKNVLNENMDESVFEKEYTRLKKDFINLTEDDLEFITKLLALKSGSPTLGLREHIEQYIQNVVQHKEDLGRQYNNTNAQLYFDLIDTTSDFSYMFDESSVVYSTIDLHMKGENVLYGSKGKFIKLIQIFNRLELVDDIRFLAINGISGEEPLIKVSNSLLNFVNKKEISSWVINDKKKDGKKIQIYKKIKGLMFKLVQNNTKVTTINLMQNGQMFIRISFPSEDRVNIDEILIDTRKSIDALITKLNSLQGIFTKPGKKIDHIYSTRIEAVTGLSNTKQNIPIDHLRSVVSNLYVFETLFEIKETLSEDSLSLYYKKHTSESLTLNVRDNPYKMDSSIVTIYGAANHMEFTTILKQLCIVLLLDTIKSRNIQKLKEKSNIKHLKKQGIDTSSTQCQGDRQPSIDPKLGSFPQSYTLEHKKTKYVCPKKDYPFPGFTKGNIVCCFKKDQRAKPSYVRNTSSIEDDDVSVQPSNYTVQITERDGTSFETHVIKVVSEYVDGFNEENSIQRYHYLSNDNNLVAITNPVLIEKLEEIEEGDSPSVWLETVPLSRIISKPPSHKCNYEPNFESKRHTDINAQCSHHKKNTVFGYNTSAYPCCFDKKRDVFPIIKDKKTKVTDSYIYKTDKLLDSKRIGVLPEALHNLFNKLINKANTRWFRMGVKQNNSSLLNAVIIAMQNDIQGKDISKSIELRRMIVDFIRSDNLVYKKLNSGNTSTKFGDMELYANFVLDTRNKLHWNDVLDVLQELTSTNIMILDIPYDGKDYQLNNTKLLCHPLVRTNKNSPCILLLKKQNNYEVIFNLDQNDKPTFLFMYNEDDTVKTNIINFLFDYQSSSCVKENAFPSNFEYKEMYTFFDMNKMLENSAHKIICQIVNKFNKVYLVLTERGVLIPVKESGIVDNLKHLHIDKLRKYNKLLNVKDLKKGVRELNDFFEYALVGVTDENKAVMTNFGRLIPIAPSDDQHELNVLPMKYYEDVDDIIAANAVINNQANAYNDKIQLLQSEVFETKKRIAENLDSDTKVIIDTLNKQLNTTRHAKLMTLVDIFTRISLSTNTVVLQHIANEVLNDNVDQLLLNNIVTSNLYDSDNVLKRDNESLLLNMDDIQKWITRFDT